MPSSILRFFAVLPFLVDSSISAPASSCNSQITCLDASVIEVVTETGPDKYEICLFGNNDLPACPKEPGDPFDRACALGGETFEPWDGNSICVEVPCGEFGTWTIKDGDACGGTATGFIPVDGVFEDNFICSSGGSCGGMRSGGKAGKQGKSANGQERDASGCQWRVLAPPCDRVDNSDTPTMSPDDVIVMGYRGI